MAACQPLPHVNGPTVSEYYGLIRLPKGLRLPYLTFRVRLPASQEPIGSPKFRAFLSTHATLFVDPGRPSESSPMRSLCVGFWYPVTPSPPALSSVTRLYHLCLQHWCKQDFRECGLPYGLCGSLCTLQLFRSVVNLLHNCNTRYGRLVRPYPTGTSTLQETPSFLVHNGCELSGPATQHASPQPAEAGPAPASCYAERQIPSCEM